MEARALRACLCHSNRSLTCEQLAMVLVGKPMDGAQATSRTQSLWASSFCSSFHWPSSSLKIHLYSQKGSSSNQSHFSSPVLEGFGFVAFRLLVYLQSTSVPFSKKLYGLNWQNLFQGTESSIGNEYFIFSYCTEICCCPSDSGNQRQLESHFPR